MFLLKKIIQLREKSHPDHEKPFLEHLEDLRKMVFRVVLTLVTSMIICFTFQKQLMDVLREPVEQVWKLQLEAKLPQKPEQAPRVVTVEQWEAAKKMEKATLGLNEVQRQAFYAAQKDQDLVFHAKSAGMLRSVVAVPEDQRESFIATLDVSDELKQQVLVLAKLGPDPEVGQRGNLRLMSALKPTETFMLSMKLSLFAGIVLAFPLLLLYILQFVLPGLHASEKRVLWPSMLIGFGLFLGGVLFAYYQVLPRALTFFYEWGGGLEISNDWRIGEYISFATQFTLLFGVAFELPVVVMVFVKLGLLSYETMSRTRSYAIVAIFVAAAVLTPTPDIMTLSLMALPMIVLYEICIWLAWFDRRKRQRADEEDARERAARYALVPAKVIYAEPEAPVENPHSDADPYVYDPVHDAAIEDWEKDYEQFHDDFDKDPTLPGDEPADAESSEDGDSKKP